MAKTKDNLLPIVSKRLRPLISQHARNRILPLTDKLGRRSRLPWSNLQMRPNLDATVKLTSCVHLARLWYLAVQPNTYLEVADKVFFR